MSDKFNFVLTEDIYITAKFREPMMFDNLRFESVPHFFPESRGQWNIMCFTKDDKYLIYTINVDPYIRFINLETFEYEDIITDIPASAPNSACTISPDGKLLLVNNRLYNTSDWSLIKVLDSYTWITIPKFSPDSTRLAFCNQTNTNFYIIDIETESIFMINNYTSGGREPRFDFSPNGLYLGYMHHFQHTSAPHTRGILRIYDYNSGSILFDEWTSTSYNVGVKFSNDSSKLFVSNISALLSDTSAVYDMSNFSRTNIFGSFISNSNNIIECTHNGKSLIVGTRPIQMLDLDTLEYSNKMEVNTNPQCIKLSNNGKFLAIGLGDRVIIVR